MPSAPSASVPAGPACPIRTAMPVSTQEAAGVEVPEIRAYKLGKKRWSYNQVELVVCEEGTDRQLTVKQAVHTGTANAPLDNCGVTFQLQLSNDEKLNLEAYLVYDGSSQTPENDHEWTLVDRCACARGCQGPVIRAIQRFGKLGKRSWAGSPSPDVTDRTNHNMKDMRYMYLSFDEAGTHVSCKAFRLAAAVFSDKTGERLGAGVSPPVRVLANNDVPTGAAHLQLLVTLPSTWPGWASAPRPVEPSFAARYAAAMDTPLPPKMPIFRRASRGAAISEDDGPASSGDPESADAATTPLTLTGGHYRTRRSTAREQPRVQNAHHLQAPPSPLCVSAGNCNSPSSLLMEGMVSRLTPTLEAAVTSPPPLHSERSLSQWLEEEIKRGPPAHVQHAHAQRLALARHQQAHAAQQLQLQQLQQQKQKQAAAAAAAATAAQQQQYGSHPAMRSLKRIRVGDDVDAGLDFPEPNFPTLLAPGPVAVAPSGGNAEGEDPIAAFVELMMMQTHHHMPVVELLPGAAAPAVPEDMAAAKAAAAAAVMRANSPFMLPDTTASICTPTPSALDDLLAGIGGPFDGLEGVNDDATFPPAPTMKVTMNPGFVGVDASAR